MVQIPSEVILACIERDDRAWRELIRLTSAPLFNLARRYLNNSDLAEDALQEAYIKVYRNLGTLRDAGRAYSWMCSIVVNECRQLYNKNKKHMGTDLEDVEFMLGTEGEAKTEMNERELNELVGAALEKMPVKLREILVLREFQGLDYEEIAKTAKLPVGTVRSRLARARDKWLEICNEMLGGQDLSELVGTEG